MGPPRPVPLGRKTGLFAWTGPSTRQIGVAQSLIITCGWLHHIRPWDDLVDVLRRVDEHPALRVGALIPRLWKTHFAHQRFRSPVESTL